MAKNNKKRANSRYLLLRKIIIALIIIIALVIEYYNYGDELFDFGSKKPENQAETTKTQVEPKPGNNEKFYTNQKLEVYFFDVGQADSILLRLGDETMLVDVGNAGDASMDTKVKSKINLTHELDRLGITEIDKLVFTHPHEDHMGSGYKILKMFKVKDLYANKLLPEGERAGYYQKFVDALYESDTHLITPTSLSEAEIMDAISQYNAQNKDNKITYSSNDYIRVGDRIDFGGAIITVLAPKEDYYSDTNDYSIVLMVEFEDVKLLLTGDAGKASEKEMLEFANSTAFDLHADILKVGHHGSRTANTVEFINRVSPSVAIIMVEEGNSYGLPDEDVIERLEKVGATIYQTMDVGDIKVIIDDGKYEIDTTYSYESK